MPLPYPGSAERDQFHCRYRNRKVLASQWGTSKNCFFVTPAQAGVYANQWVIDSGLKARLVFEVPVKMNGVLWNQQCS